MPFRVLALALVACGTIFRPASCFDRYVAWRADGSRLTAAELTAWPVPGTTFRFANEELIASSNPVRLLVDRQRSSTLRGPWLLLANGDVLPGMPVEFAGPGSVRVALEPPLVPIRGATLEVRADRIRRFVRSPRDASRQPVPGTIVLADGRQLTARSIRWREQGLAALTAEGVVEVPFADLADVAFPDIGVMPAVLDDNLRADGGEAPALVRMQATNGATITTARVRREQQQDVRRMRATDGAVYYLQPAWAQQPLVVPEPEVVCCGYRSGNEAPLSAFPASEIYKRQVFGRSPAWSLNQPATGRLLAARDRMADLGLATRSESAIAFELPPEARELSLAVGIDAALGDGGCVQCTVLAGETLWDSGVMQGKDGVRESGTLDIAAKPAVQLVTGMAHDERPPGADPFDIRDQVVWLFPLVTLDLSGARERRAATLLSGLAEWQVTSGNWPEIELGSRWSELADQWDSILRLPQGNELILARRLSVSRASDVVELLTVSPTDLDAHEFELEVDGQVVPWRNNADRSQLRQWMLRNARTRSRDRDEETNLTERLAYWWDLAAWRGQEVELRFTLRGTSERNEIAWRGLALRSAIANLPPSGGPFAPEVRLTTLTPVPGSDKRGARAAPEEPIRLLGQDFADGISLARDSRVVYALQPEWKSFVAVVGCTTQVAGPVQVLIDDRVAWERTAMNSLNAAQQISIPLPPGSRTLTLVNGAEGLFYGYAAFAEAGFTTQ